MPSRDEGGFDQAVQKSCSSSDTVDDDGFTNISTARVTMTGWSTGSDFDAETTGSSLSRKMSAATEEATASSYTHVADEPSASVSADKGDLAKRRSSGEHKPKQRNHVKIEAARSKVRKKEELLTGLMESSEQRVSLPSNPSLRMNLEADEATFERHATLVDGGMEQHRRESTEKKFVLFPHKTKAP